MVILTTSFIQLFRDINEHITMVILLISFGIFGPNFVHPYAVENNW